MANGLMQLSYHTCVMKPLPQQQQFSFCIKYRETKKKILALNHAELLILFIHSTTFMHSLSLGWIACTYQGREGLRLTMFRFYCKIWIERGSCCFFFQHLLLITWKFIYYVCMHCTPSPTPYASVFHSNHCFISRGSHDIGFHAQLISHLDLIHTLDNFMMSILLLFIFL